MFSRAHQTVGSSTAVKVVVPASSRANDSATSCSSSSDVTIPSVSVTITAVATSLPDTGGSLLTPATTTTTAASTPVLDTPTITSLVLNSLEGVHSGVPTRTTPTLTPTTLRNIEQTFLELSTVQPPENHSNQAGFVPPLVQPSSGNTFISVDSKCWGGGTLTQVSTHSNSSTSSTCSSTSSAPLRLSTSTAPPTSGAGAMPAQVTLQHQAAALHGHAPRRTGGRRPVKDERLSAEEEERRLLRRERNKLAAARCRKRRLDQTNLLQDETDGLEDKKSELQNEIQVLQQQRDELEFLLATHKAVCRRRLGGVVQPAVTSAPVTSSPITIHQNTTTTAAPIRVSKKTAASLVKEEPMDDFLVVKPEVKVTAAEHRPRRPTSLNVAPVALRTPSVADLGVPIETPSAGLRGLNFESMMDGGTGLTPVTSGTGLTPLHTGLTPLTTPIVSAPNSSNNCGSQQRSSSSDLSSPDSVPPKLVSL